MMRLLGFLGLAAFLGCSPITEQEATQVLKRRYDQHDVVWLTTIVRPPDPKGRYEALVPKVDEGCAEILQKHEIAKILPEEGGSKLRPLKGRFIEDRFEYPCGLWVFDRVESMEVVHARRVKVRFSQHHDPPKECVEIQSACSAVRSTPRKTVLEITMDRDSRGDWFPKYWSEISAS